MEFVALSLSLSSCQWAGGGMAAGPSLYQEAERKVRAWENDREKLFLFLVARG